jgi:hypothetical protein
MAEDIVQLDRLKELLKYDPMTGDFTRLTNTGGRRAGSTAGSVNQKNGYRYVSVDGRYYLAHRLGWFFVNGVWPEGDLDHINRCRTDNRLGNLREVTSKENGENYGPFSNNTSGHRGVTWDTSRHMWVAQIKHHGRQVSLGRFRTKAEAIAARKGAERVAFTHSEENEATT